MLAFSFFAAIFSTIVWIIYALAYISDNTVGVKFSSLGMVDIAVYVGLVALPVLVLWMVFGYINQHINNQRTSKALYQLFLQMKKNQDYTDLVARIMLESEQQIKDGFILNRIDILISDMNELIAEIINRAALASRDQIESLWSRVRNGGKWALGKVIIEINQNQPNFQMRLYEKAQNDVVLSGTILEFCARYQNILTLLSKHDGERVFLSVIESGVFGKVFTILAPLSDEIRKFRESNFHKDNSVEFKAPVAEKTQSHVQNPYAEKMSADLLADKKNPIFSGLSKLGSLIKKDKNQSESVSETADKDPFSIALERSFGSVDNDEKLQPSLSLPEGDLQNNNLSVSENGFEVQADIAVDNIQTYTDSNNEAAPDIHPEPIAVPITNTQKTLNNLRKEWEDMKKNSADEPSLEPKFEKPQAKAASDDVISYPFGGWTDESNYHK